MIDLRGLISLVVFILALASLALNLYLYFRRRKDTKDRKIFELEAEKKFRNFEEEKRLLEIRTAEEIYSAALKEELGTIHLLGSPDISSYSVRLEDAFVSLSIEISQSWRSEDRFDTSTNGEEIEVYAGERFLSPGEAMKRAFKKYRLLLIIGDPGSGKTTLLKYFAMMCLDKNAKKWEQLGFKEKILPLYFPLRELEFDADDEPASLPEILERWCKKRLLDISAEQFLHWLREQRTLVMLDGLDEISSKEHRQKVCNWISRLCIGLSKAYFVVTSRPTGYRKLDGIELEITHLRGDIMDFTPQQQEEFFRKWFRAVFLSGLPVVDIPEPQWQERQLNRSAQQAETIIDFLSREENKAVRELTAVPMLLHIMAIIWKDRDYLPGSRAALFDISLNYLLEYRDRRKNIVPLLRAEVSRRVLAPTALWMQEELQKDEAPKKEMHRFMQPILNTLEMQPQAQEFCEYLRDRTGLIGDYGRDHYIFRHKSFREFLAGIQLNRDAHETKRLEALIHHFNEDWWEETLRFFIGKSDDTIFDQFMRLFFQSSVSEQLDAHRQTLLHHLIREAPQKRIDALVESLNSNRLNSNQKRYVMDCLKTIGTPEAFQAIEKADKSGMDESTRSYAQDIIAEAAEMIQKVSLIEIPGQKELETLPSFRNSFEYNVEYIKIPGGTYKYSVSKEMETIPDFYLCKYPVTNKRYRRFISFLEGSEKELLKNLPLDLFAEKLMKFSRSIKGYGTYFSDNNTKWPIILRSRLDDDKKFNGDDQPVIGVCWYAARAYCFWLSCLEAAFREGKKLENMDVSQIASIYRLPTEIEWEWAAGGEPKGPVRDYPWPKEKGDPNSNLANYDKNVGSTTPVGRYPDGATPQGLMDMAGNVWEWMDNNYDQEKEWFSLRGGSWFDDNNLLRCSARSSGGPDYRYDVIGFRVLRTHS